MSLPESNPSSNPDAWRDAKAAAEEEKARALGQALFALTVAEAIYEDEGADFQSKLAEVRSCMGLLRMDATTFVGRARELRAHRGDRQPGPAQRPATITRRPRPAAPPDWGEGAVS